MSRDTECANRFLGDADRHSFYGAMEQLSWCVVCVAIMAIETSQPAATLVNSYASASKYGSVYA